MSDKPYIPLEGGMFDGKRLPDPQLKIKEDDLVKIYSKRMEHEKAVYVVTEDAVGIPMRADQIAIGRDVWQVPSSRLED